MFKMINYSVNLTKYALRNFISELKTNNIILKKKKM